MVPLRKQLAQHCDQHRGAPAQAAGGGDDAGGGGRLGARIVMRQAQRFRQRGEADAGGVVGLFHQATPRAAL
ncbi:hypothetical protein DYS74_16205 [Sinirhodobacter hankyongi]|uniref:Uncharacterized protein n=1 Tax=Paenirhodobacter hankyongi TaxID=2294033 RepID=A0A421BKJ3_9RHOB|nr:hypothetical protein DYS74_16205 [Sinirhodobacter hankyongi]